MCCQPGNRHGLPASETDRRRRYSIKMQSRWNHARPAAGLEGRKPEANGAHNEQGLEVTESLSPSGRGTKMSLTSPLIEQAFAQACAVCSPQSGRMSAIGMFQQLMAPALKPALGARSHRFSGCTAIGGGVCSRRPINRRNGRFLGEKGPFLTMRPRRKTYFLGRFVCVPTILL